MCPKDAEEITNSEDPEQTATLGAVLIWVCTVCPDLTLQYFYSVWKTGFNIKLEVLFKCQFERG